MNKKLSIIFGISLVIGITLVVALYYVNSSKRVIKVDTNERIENDSLESNENPIVEVPKSNNTKLLVYKLPHGWTSESVLEDYIDDIKMEHVSIVYAKDNSYRIDVVRGSTGRAFCEFADDSSNYVVINNLFVKSKIIRLIPEKYGYNAEDPLHLSVCSVLDKDGSKYEVGTILGDITYTIPKNYDKEVLLEMDQIVESIHLPSN